MIELKQVTKTYAKNNKKAVDNLNLSVEGGELFGFIGPNGAGKTTTIKLMTGILTPDEGTITMAGHDMARDRKAHIEKYLEIFELKDAINSQVRSYSKGMKQKLVVIGALIHNPPIWILDEPLGGLDPRAAHLLKEEMIHHCKKGNTVFFSTHVLEVAEKLCSRIGVIANGHLRAEGTLEKLRSGEKGASLEELFLELTDDGGDKE